MLLLWFEALGYFFGGKGGGGRRHDLSRNFRSISQADINIKNFLLPQVSVSLFYRFVCEGTVEDKISSLQEKKKELAQKVLSGTGSSFTKLSLADLRVIFGV